MSSEMLSARSPILALIISGHLIKHTQAINSLIGWEFTSTVSIYNNVIPVSPVCSHGRSRSRGHRHAHLIAPSDHSALITVLIMGITLLHIRPFIASFNSQRLTPPACKKLPVRREVGAPQNWSADCERERWGHGINLLSRLIFRLIWDPSPHQQVTKRYFYWGRRWTRKRQTKTDCNKFQFFLAPSKKVILISNAFQFICVCLL